MNKTADSSSSFDRLIGVELVALQRNILLKKATDLKAMKQLQFDVLLAPQISKGPSYSPTLAQSPDGGTQPSVP